MAGTHGGRAQQHANPGMAQQLPQREYRPLRWRIFEA